MLDAEGLGKIKNEGSTMEARQGKLMGTGQEQVFKCGLCDVEQGFSRYGLLRHYVDVHSVAEGKAFGMVIVLEYKKRRHRATKKAVPSETSS